MEPIHWHESNSVNNLTIDNQHKKLFQLANNLIINSDAKANSEIICETLHDLLIYCKSHFKEEEIFLENNNYPKLEEHRQKHNLFIYKVAMFCKDVSEGKTCVTKEMIKFLTDWIVHHTKVDDLDYKNYA